MLSAKSLSPEDYLKILKNYPEVNFLQSLYWKQLHERLDIKTEAIAIYRYEKIIGAMFLIIKDARRGRYVEIAGGPLIDWNDEEVVKFTTHEIKNTAKKYRAVFARIRPQLEQSKNAEKIFAENGYKKAPMHLHAEHTSILNLQQADEEILKNMRRQTRYDVKKAERLGIKVKSYIAKEKIAQFIKLQNETAKRQGFVTSSEVFLKTLAKTFGPNATIYISTTKGRVLNMGLILKHGQEVDYFEAASSIESYKMPGAYALLWQAIKDAKRENYKRFNFWGISYNKDPHNRYAGVTTFKRGFGGEDVTYLPAHDLVFNHVKYSLNWLIETARRKKRRL